MTYAGELAAKQDFVRDAFRRIGGFDPACEPIIPSPEVDAYRNKAEFAIGTDAEGKLYAGFYSERTHRVVPIRDCRLVPEEFLKIVNEFIKIANENVKKTIIKENPGKFSEKKDKLFRHLVLRRSGITGEKSFPKEAGEQNC